MYIMAEKCQWGYASTPTNNSFLNYLDSIISFKTTFIGKERPNLLVLDQKRAFRA